jgi:hypothetical protein
MLINPEITTVEKFESLDILKLILDIMNVLKILCSDYWKCEELSILSSTVSELNLKMNI